jgi:hypothetical protein
MRLCTMNRANEKLFELLFEFAGYSHDPKKETRFQARELCAECNYFAYRKAQEDGYTFEWERDQLDSSEWSDEKPAYEQWCCTMFNAEHEPVASLGGIDFGRDSPEPWGKPYKTVVEAELACEHFT